MIEYLKRMKWSQCEFDPAVFVRGDVYMAVYVDDAVMTGSREQMDKAWAEIRQRSRTTEVQPCERVLGMNIKKDIKGEMREIKIDMSACIEKMVNEAREYLPGIMVKPCDTPCTTDLRRYDTEMESTVPKWEHQKVIGALLWAARCRGLPRTD